MRRHHHNLVDHPHRTPPTSTRRHRPEVAQPTGPHHPTRRAGHRCPPTGHLPLASRTRTQQPAPTVDNRDHRSEPHRRSPLPRPAITSLNVQRGRVTYPQRTLREGRAAPTRPSTGAAPHLAPTSLDTVQLDHPQGICRSGTRRALGPSHPGLAEDKPVAGLIPRRGCDELLQPLVIHTQPLRDRLHRLPAPVQHHRPPLRRCSRRENEVNTSPANRSRRSRTASNTAAMTPRSPHR